jgi:hypothetical protein
LHITKWTLVTHNTVCGEFSKHFVQQHSNLKADVKIPTVHTTNRIHNSKANIAAFCFIAVWQTAAISCLFPVVQNTCTTVITQDLAG